MPFSIVPAAAAVACCSVVDMCTLDPGRALPVPVSGPESSWSSRGECASAGLYADPEDDVGAAAGDDVDTGAEDAVSPDAEEDAGEDAEDDASGPERLVPARRAEMAEPLPDDSQATPSAPTASAVHTAMPT